MLLFTAALILILILFTVKTVDVILHSRSVPFLQDQKVPAEIAWPPVSIIFSARNEEAEIAASLRSHLSQDYPDFEVIVINDRSQDQTAQQIKEVQAEYKNLKVIHIDQLKPGWVAKNHALWSGYQHARGQWILFTDADVDFGPSALKKAMAYALDQHVDHLTVLPEVKSKQILKTITLVAFNVLMGFMARPWKLKDPDAKDALGIGAFNLLRRSAYEKIGTHADFADELIDDVELGRRIKQHRLKLDGVVGQGLISLAWYPHARAIIKGLEKNSFAGLKFSYVCAGVGILFPLLFSWGPWLGLALLPGMLKIVAGIILLEQWITFICIRRYQAAPLWSFLLMPLGFSIMTLALVNSVIRVTLDRGVRWRDTFYPRYMFPKTTWRDVVNVLRGNFYDFND